MPSEAHEQRRLSAMPASLGHDPFSDAIGTHGQEEIGFWKSDSNPNRNVMNQAIVSRSKPVTNFQSMTDGSHQSVNTHQSHFLREQDGILGLQHLMGSEKKSNMSVSTWKSTDFNFDFLSNLHQQSKPLNAEVNGTGDIGVHENSLFSNSLPEMFSQKVTSSSRNALFHRQTDEVHSNLNEDEPFESLQEMEARTIGNLLPDDDDLFSGVDEIEGVPRSNIHDEDDIFGSLGGMELEIDGLGSNRGSRSNDMIRGGEPAGANGAYFGEHPHGERPSRTLFVRNINSNVEDEELRFLFERYGDVQMMYTSCKHRGFVMISYYDIRSASDAIKQLQNKPLRSRNLDIHYSIPKDNPSEKDINQGTIIVSNLESSVSDDDIRHIFGVYGDIKQIREVPNTEHQKNIEFYDIRAAEATFLALDGKNIAGKQIKLEPSCPPFMTHCGLMQQFPSDIEHEEANRYQQGSPLEHSAVHLGTTPVQTNGSFSIGSVQLQGPYPAPQGTISLGFDSAPNGFSSSFPHLLSPPIPSLGNLHNQLGIAGIEGALGRMNLSYQRMPNIHSHSLPEHQNGFPIGNGHNSARVMPGMDVNIIMRPKGIDGRLVNGSLPYDHGSVFGAPGNAGFPLHGHQYPRNRFPSYDPPHGGHIMWQNSPPFFNNMPVCSPTQMHGFPRTSSHMPNNLTPFPHHVGSAPTSNAPMWDRRHGYTGDVMEGSPFHPSSIASMGFSVSPTLHQMDLASPNIYPFGDGSCMEPPLPSSHIGIPSPQKNYQMFGGQNPMIHFNSRYDVPGDRMRSRRSDPTASQGDNKKQFELDIERIMRGEDNRTTLMIKNIPNKYTSKMLLATIDEYCRGTYNFIYLPIDFKNKCNVGYAFINLIDPKKIVPFYETFNGKKWEKFNSEKVASLAYARIQGKAALVAHFQNSSLMNEDKRCRPILFHSDGPNAGDQEPFPMGSNVRSRTGRSRTLNSDDDQQGSPPGSFSAEETSNELSSPPRSKKSGDS